MAKLNEQGINAVKKAVGVAALTGPTGQTMGQAGKSAKQGTLPAFQGGKMPMGGELNEVKITATPLKKEPEFSTFNFNSIYKVGDTGYDSKDLEIAHKKILSTYGEDSDENKAFLAMLGVNPKDFYGGDWKKIMKPDLRQDSKSYTDSAQYEFSGGKPLNIYNYRGGSGNRYSTNEEQMDNVKSLFNKLVKQFGIKPSRALSNDPQARQKQ